MSKLPTTKHQAERLLNKAIKYPQQLTDEEVLFLNKILEVAHAFEQDEILAAVQGLTDDIKAEGEHQDMKLGDN